MTRNCRTILLHLAAALWAAPAIAAAASTAPACPAVLDKTIPRLQDDQPQNLCQYAGKVILVVNTASYCGFTPQYKGLEALYRKFGPQGLVVLGFPSDDFHQEMADPGKIATFCKNTYDVQFPMFTPSHVTEPEPNVLYKALIKATGGQPKWNFYKYLIARDGTITGPYSSMTKPDDPAFVAKIETLLAARP